MRDKFFSKSLIYLSFIVFIVLILLRYVVIIFPRYDIIYLPNRIKIFHDYTYIFTLLFILLNIKRLKEFYIGLYTIIFITIWPFINYFIVYFTDRQSYYDYKLEMLSVLIFYFLLVLIIIIFKPKIYIEPIKKYLLWILIAIILGATFKIVMGYLNDMFRVNGKSISLFVYLFTSQTMNAAILEEPLFRGIMWKYLRNLNLNAFWICTIQALCFMLGHIYYFDNYKFSFWILVPLAGLLLGFIAWRSRNITSSIVAHGIINSL